MGGAFVVANVVALVLVALGVGLDGGAFLLTVIAPWLSLAGWPLWATRRRGNGAAIDLGLRLRAIDLGYGLLGGLAALAAGIVAGLITASVLGDFTSAAGDEALSLAETSSPAVLVIFALMVVLGAPIAEELTFRGLLWSGLSKGGRPVWVSIAVSTGAFALMHFEPVRLLVLVAIGGVLGIVRWRTASLGACIVAHAVNNLPGALGILALGFGSH